MFRGSFGTTFPLLEPLELDIFNGGTKPPKIVLSSFLSDTYVLRKLAPPPSVLDFKYFPISLIDQAAATFKRKSWLWTFSHIMTHLLCVCLGHAICLRLHGRCMFHAIEGNSRKRNSLPLFGGVNQDAKTASQTQNFGQCFKLLLSQPSIQFIPPLEEKKRGRRKRRRRKRNLEVNRWLSSIL